MAFGQRVRDSASLEELREKATGMGAVLAGEFLPQVSKFYREMFASRSPLLATSIWQLQVEEILFCLHLLDRVAAISLGADSRAVFMDAMFVGVRDALSNLYRSENEASAFREWVWTTYNARQLEYGGYTFPEEGGHDKGTLFWEFGKKMDQLADDTNPVRVMEITLHGMGLFEMMSEVVDECVAREP